MELSGSLNKEIIDLIKESRKYTNEEEIMEFINWVDKHNQFEDLINEKEVKKLGDELEELENYIDKLKKKYKK